MYTLAACSNSSSRGLANGLNSLLSTCCITGILLSTLCSIIPLITCSIRRIILLYKPSNWEGNNSNCSERSSIVLYCRPNPSNNA